MFRRIIVGLAIIVGLGVTVTACSSSSPEVTHLEAKSTAGMPTPPSHTLARVTEPPSSKTPPRLVTHSATITALPWQGSTLSFIQKLSGGRVECKAGFMAITPRLPIGSVQTPKGVFSAEQSMPGDTSDRIISVPQGVKVRGAVVNSRVGAAIHAYNNTRAIKFEVVDFGPIHSITLCISH